MKKGEKYFDEEYFGNDKWRQNYTRALIAGRVVEPRVFPKILAAIEQEENKPGSGFELFREACSKVMMDLPDKERELMIGDMWRATWASRKPDQPKSCW